MTREEAIIQLRLGPGINEDVSEVYNDAINIAIEALQQEPKWIPVTERLPETGEIVLITETSWTIRGIDVDWWNGEQWVRNGKYVTAWQPLPEPYKESDGE